MGGTVYAESLTEPGHSAGMTAVSVMPTSAGWSDQCPRRVSVHAEITVLPIPGCARCRSGAPRTTVS